MHFFKNCPKVNEFWSYWINWSTSTTGTSQWHSHKKKTPNFEECIIFGFPLHGDAIQVLNFCLLYTKYYIYIQLLFHGNILDLYTCLTQLKFDLEIEYNICKSTNNEICFNKISASLSMIAYKNIVNMISDYINIWCHIFN